MRKTLADYFDERGRFVAPRTEEELEEYYALLSGTPVAAVQLPSERPLDEVLKTRSHVRIARALTLLDENLNLTASDAARRAGVSPPRALDVLRQLERAGVARGHRAAAWSIWTLNPDSPLVPLLRSLFEGEAALSDRPMPHPVR